MNNNHSILGNLIYNFIFFSFKYYNWSAFWATGLQGQCCGHHHHHLDSFANTPGSEFLSLQIFLSHEAAMIPVSPLRELGFKGVKSLVLKHIAAIWKNQKLNCGLPKFSDTSYSNLCHPWCTMTFGLLQWFTNWLC